jgi:hypothetical protein
MEFLMSTAKPLIVSVMFKSYDLVSEVTVVECPRCFALVREGLLDEHERSHDEN